MPEKRQQIKESVVRSPKKSYHRRAQEVSLTLTTLLCSMRSDLKLLPFRIFTHRLERWGQDQAPWNVWVIEREDERSPGWLNNIWFCDEAHYHLNGAVNNHNNVFWREEVNEKHLKGTKVTVWIAFNPIHGLFGLYWFQDRLLWKGKKGSDPSHKISTQENQNKGNQPHLHLTVVTWLP